MILYPMVTGSFQAEKAVKGRNKHRAFYITNREKQAKKFSPVYTGFAIYPRLGNHQPPGAANLQRAFVVYVLPTPKELVRKNAEHVVI